MPEYINDNNCFVAPKRPRTRPRLPTHDSSSQLLFASWIIRKTEMIQEECDYLSYSWEIEMLFINNETE